MQISYRRGYRTKEQHFSKFETANRREKNKKLGKLVLGLIWLILFKFKFSFKTFTNNKVKDRKLARKILCVNTTKILCPNTMMTKIDCTSCVQVMD